MGDGESMRSGDEPAHARSPLRLRVVLAAFGLVTSTAAAVVLFLQASFGFGLLFVAVALMAAVDLLVIGRHIRQGPHLQPGPSVPPYRPLEPDRPVRPPAESVSEQARMRRYFAVMVPCLVLIVLAWSVVRLFSTPAAVAMSMVAAVLPPIAVVIANFGVQMPDASARPVPANRDRSGMPDPSRGRDHGGGDASASGE